MYRLNEEKMFYDMAEGQAIVINTENGLYYGASSMGSAVLDALVGGASEEAVLRSIRALPGCPEDIHAQLQVFLARLMELEILVPAEGAGGPAPTFDRTALGNGFAMTADVYADVQELLMADPVHEVDVDLGWQPEKQG